MFDVNVPYTFEQVMLTRDYFANGQLHRLRDEWRGRHRSQPLYKGKPGPSLHVMIDAIQHLSTYGNFTYSKEFGVWLHQA